MRLPKKCTLGGIIQKRRNVLSELCGHAGCGRGFCGLYRMRDRNQRVGHALLTRYLLMNVVNYATRLVERVI